MNSYEIIEFEKKCNNSIKCVFDAALNEIFKTHTIDSTVNGLIYSILKNFVNFRNFFFDSILDLAYSDEVKVDLHRHLDKILNSIKDSDEVKALRALKLSFDDFIGYVRSHGIDLSV